MSARKAGIVDAQWIPGTKMVLEAISKEVPIQRMRSPTQSTVHLAGEERENGPEDCAEYGVCGEY